MNGPLPITERQKTFLLQLRAEKGLENKFDANYLDGISRRKASLMIEKALTLPSVTTVSRVGSRIAAPHEDDVPAGRYAITDEDGVLKFFQVDRPKEGRWAGYVFLKIQASADLHPIKSPARKEFIYKAIAHDPRAASIRYGRELGHCGICGRTLTDPDSIAAGIGPVCAGKAGW